MNVANGNKTKSASGTSGGVKIQTPGIRSENLNWLIHLSHVTGHCERAKNLIKQALEQSGARNVFAYYKQGIIMNNEGKIQGALDSFQQCLKLEPNNIVYIIEVAKCLCKMQRYRLALETFLEAEHLANEPNWDISYHIACCYLNMEEKFKAKEYAEKSVKYGNNEEAFTLLIQICIQINDFASAIAACNRAIAMYPDNIDMLTEAGMLHLKTGDSQTAFQKFSAALALNPLSPRSLLGLGCITQIYGDHDAALAKYKLALDHNPDSLPLWNNIGSCFYSKQKYIAAISCLMKAVWLTPLNWKVQFNLGLAHLAVKQPASAFNYFCATVNLRPDFGRGFAFLGCSLVELKDNENADRAFTQALQLSKDDTLVILNAIIFYLKCDELLKAANLAKYLKGITHDKTLPKEEEDMFNYLKQCGIITQLETLLTEKNSSSTPDEVPHISDSITKDTGE